MYATCVTVECIQDLREKITKLANITYSVVSVFSANTALPLKTKTKKFALDMNLFFNCDMKKCTFEENKG